MSPGPLPKSTGLKVDARDRRPKPVALPDESLTATRPDPPEGLEADLIPIWESVLDELSDRGAMPGALRFTDGIALSTFIAAISNHRQATAAIRDLGLVVKGRWGPMPNPYLKIQKDAAAEIRLLSSELGLSPASRTRMGLQTLASFSIIGEISRQLDDR